MSHKTYTLTQAEAVLPKLRPLMQDGVQLHALLRSAAQRLSASGVDVTSDLLAGRTRFTARTEVLQCYARARALYTTIQQRIAQMESLGADVQDLELGYADFHTWRDGEHEAALCWQLGETEIRHFHSHREDCEQRHRVELETFAAIRSRRENAE